MERERARDQYVYKCMYTHTAYIYIHLPPSTPLPSPPLSACLTPQVPSAGGLSPRETKDLLSDYKHMP